jgi:hypothetical protein
MLTIGAVLGLSTPLFSSAKHTPKSAPETVTAKPFCSSLYSAPEAIRRAAPKAIRDVTAAPLAFEETRGQTSAEEKFTSRGERYGVILASDGATLILDSPQSCQQTDSSVAEATSGAASLRIYPIGADPKSRMLGTHELARKSNYFMGNDPQRWRRNVPNFLKVRYENIYPGIDMEYYFSHDDLEYDFILSAGSDPASIVVGYRGHKEMRIDENGELLLELAGHSIRQRLPSVYQELNGVRREITARYVTRGSNAIGKSSVIMTDRRLWSSVLF